jgi:hypothetical protein
VYGSPDNGLTRFIGNPALKAAALLGKDRNTHDGQSHHEQGTPLERVPHIFTSITSEVLTPPVTQVELLDHITSFRPDLSKVAKDFE